MKTGDGADAESGVVDSIGPYACSGFRKGEGALWKASYCRPECTPGFWNNGTSSGG